MAPVPIDLNANVYMKTGNKLIYIKLLLLLISIFFVGCSREEKIQRETLDFNRAAKESYVKNLNSYDLKPISEWQMCILNEGITKYLDSINNWRTEIIDSFYVRNYNFKDLGTHFTFVSTKKGEYYFLYLPQLYEYITTNEYYKFVNGRFELKDSLNITVAKINSSMLDHFLETEVFDSNDIQSQYNQTDHLLDALFPELFYHELLISSFLDSLKKEPQKNYEHIKEIIDPILFKEKHTRFGVDFRIYDLNPFGFILLDFSEQETNPAKLKLDMYFIPHKFGYIVTSAIEPLKYKQCYQ